MELFKSVFAAAGLVILAYWFVRWTIQMFKRQTELSNVEKDLRTALQARLDFEQSSRAVEKNEYSESIAKMNREMDGLKSVVGQHRDQVSGLKQQTELLVYYAHTLFASGVRNSRNIMTDKIFPDVLDVLVSCGGVFGMSANGLVELLERGWKQKDLPSNPSERLIYHLGKLYDDVRFLHGQTDGFLAAVASMSECIIEYPGMTEADLRSHCTEKLARRLYELSQSYRTIAKPKELPSSPRPEENQKQEPK